MDAVLEPISVRRARRRGFSYLDVMLAIVIIAVAVAALMQSMTTTTKVTAASRQAGVAVNLARNIHEFAMSKENVAQLDALNDVTYATPIGSDGQPLTGYTGWTQTVQVSRVLADATHDIKDNADATANTRLRRLTVVTKFKGGQMYKETWLVAATGF